MNHISAVCRGPRQAVHKLEEHEDGRINIVNTGSNSNRLPFHILKILFPKSAINLEDS